VTEELFPPDVVEKMGTRTLKVVLHVLGNLGTCTHDNELYKKFMNPAIFKSS